MTTRNTPEGTSKTRERTSVSLDKDLLRRAKLAGGANFSGYVEEALRAKLIDDGMRAYAKLRAADPADDLFDAAEADAA
ncbi:type II toxin-antitoxin system CcdA family antitoxin [Streptomyces sp. NPDC016172]|uniref:type II toxin-antitoxin system CcdA family antitoxin n=1 Tax=Streptomyces sp. NPDC016172 TaxID=3364964 RepID=UPI003701B788